MKIETAFLANHAEVRGGLLYLNGGFPERWTLPNIPSQAAMGLALVLRLAADEVDQEFDGFLELISPGKSDVKRLAAFQTKRGAQDDDMPGDSPRYHLVAIFPALIPVEAEGLHHIVVTVADESVSIPVWVRVGLMP